jgi:autotransporter-associated beta strand protein
MGNSTITLDNVNVGSGGVAELAFSDSSPAHTKNLVVGSNGGAIVMESGEASFTGASGTLNGPLEVQLAADTTLTLGHSLTGASGSLIVRSPYASDQGTLILSNVQHYSGGTTIHGGTILMTSTSGPVLTGDVYFVETSSEEDGTYRQLHCGADNQLDNTTRLHFGADSRLRLYGTTQTVGILDYDDAGSSSLAMINNSQENTAATLIVDNSTDCSYRGILRDMESAGVSTGTFALKKRGSGKLTIGGNKSGQYTGGLTVEEGTLDYYNGVFLETPVPGVLPGGNYTIVNGTLVTGILSASVNAFQITGGLVDADDTNPGTITSNTTFDVQGGTVEAVLAGDQGLAKTGTAEAILKADNSYTGNTTITQGTLTLAGQGQINASSPILNEATFRIADGVAAHTVGTISGTGTTQLNTDAQLTAASVKQGSLTIGAGAKLTIAPVAAGGGPAPVPEPGAWALLLAGWLSVAAWRRLRRP